MSDAHAELKRELRAELPPAFAELGDADAATLTGLLAGARRRQQTALDKALDDSLGFLPRILRGPVKRALGL